MNNSRTWVTLGIVGLVAAGVWAAQAVRVSINGKTVPGRTIDGSVYVKLTDVARALDRQVVKKGGAYELVTAGGANQLEGTNGKVGQELFTGKWKFLVKAVQRTDKYMLRYADSKFEIQADPGSELVVVDCRFKNGVRESAYIYFNGLTDTALADREEHAYKPKWMDVGGGVADTILPGAAKDFAIVFSVPEGVELKDLIYTIEPVDLKKFGLTKLRIALQ